MRDKMGRSAKVTQSVFAALLLAFFAVGCAKNEQSPHEPSPRQTGDVALRAIDEKELGAVIESHRGKVVLVDYWATWCLSCVELFPHTVQLHEEFGDKGLAVISVSLDDTESRAAVLAFLENSGAAAFDNFISVYGASGESLEKFGLPGPLPQLRLYDRKGNLHRVFPQPQSSVKTEDIDEAVRELLAESR